jgi:hypothetical protein
MKVFGDILNTSQMQQHCDDQRSLVVRMLVTVLLELKERRAAAAALCLQHLRDVFEENIGCRTRGQFVPGSRTCSKALLFVVLMMRFACQ